MTRKKPVDQRADYRYRYTAELSFGSDTNIGKGLIQNISRGGVLVNAEPNIPIGTELLLTLPFPNSNRCISLHGTITRITEDGFAISFRRGKKYSNFHGGYWEL